MLSNGEPIIRIGRKGKRRVQFGDGPVIEVDVIALHNAWAEIDRQHRDEKGNIPPEHLAALNQAAWNFVRQVLTAGAGPEQQAEAQLLAESISLAEALEFLTRITEEGLALRSFFEVKLPGGPSSQESTELRFST